MNTSKLQASLGFYLARGALVLAVLLAIRQPAAAQNAGDSFQAYPLRHAQAAEVESQFVRLLAGLPTPAEVIADPRNNRLLVRGPQQAHELVQQMLRTLDRPVDGTPDEAVLRTYPATGDIAAKTRELQAAFATRPGVRIAFDARTSQILVLAPADVQVQIARQLGVEPTAASQAAPATIPQAALPPGQVVRPLSLPTAQPRNRTVTLKNTTWEQVERSLATLVKGRFKRTAASSPDVMSYVLTLGDESEIQFHVANARNQVELRGNPALVESGARLVQVLDAPQALKNQNQKVLPITAHEAGRAEGRAIAASLRGSAGRRSGSRAASRGTKQRRAIDAGGTGQCAACGGRCASRGSAGGAIVPARARTSTHRSSTAPCGTGRARASGRTACRADQRPAGLRCRLSSSKASTCWSSTATSGTWSVWRPSSRKSSV